MARLLRLVALLVFSICATLAQRVCKGIIRGPAPVLSDINVVGGICLLEDVAVTGSVTVTGNGSLLTSGNVTVSGSLRVYAAMEVQLRGILRVLGGFSASVTPRILVGREANVGIVSINQIGTFLVGGSMTSLSAISSPNIRLHGAKILGGGIFLSGYSNIEICGASVSGGIALSEATGNLNAVVSRRCAASELTGSVIVSSVRGNVNIIGNMMRAADLLITNLIGDVMLMDAGISDMSITRVQGNLAFRRIVTDSDSAITLVQGYVEMVNSTVGGDMIVSNNQAVSYIGNNLGNEVLTITGNLGFVTVSHNSGFSGSITENKGVMFSGNVARGAHISKNGRTIIRGNHVVRGLNCADNAPAPFGYGNTFGPLAANTGQCAKFTRA